MESDSDKVHMGGGTGMLHRVLSTQFLMFVLMIRDYNVKQRGGSRCKGKVASADGAICLWMKYIRIYLSTSVTAEETSLPPSR